MAAANSGSSGSRRSSARVAARRPARGRTGSTASGVGPARGKRELRVDGSRARRPGGARAWRGRHVGDLAAQARQPEPLHAQPQAQGVPPADIGAAVGVVADPGGEHDRRRVERRSRLRARRRARRRAAAPQSASSASRPWAMAAMAASNSSSSVGLRRPVRCGGRRRRRRRWRRRRARRRRPAATAKVGWAVNTQAKRGRSTVARTSRSGSGLSSGSGRISRCGERGASRACDRAGSVPPT